MWELYGNFGIWQKQGMLLVFGLFSDVLRVHGRQKHRTFLCCLVFSTPNSWVPNCPTASTAAVSRVFGRLVVVSEALNIPVVGFILQPHREIEPVSAGYLGIDDLWWYCVDVWFVAANWTMTIIMFSWNIFFYFWCKLPIFRYHTPGCSITPRLLLDLLVKLLFFGRN